VIEIEARSIADISRHLDEHFVRAVDLVLSCAGNVVTTGLGKAGIIAQKISATLASTGTPSIFLHAAEALHGDLGRIRPADLVVFVSNSGETLETKRLMPLVKKIGAGVIVITGQRDSTLARHAGCVLNIGPVDEACPLGLAPTASTSALLALGDALAMVVLAERRFGREDYALYHPAGNLGRKLMRVEEVMRKGEELPLARSGASLWEVLEVMNNTPGRPGAALILSPDGKLAGIFTDGDLRRLLQKRDIDFLKLPIDELFVRNPKFVGPGVLVEEAERMLKEHRVDQLPVLDEDGRPVGLLDVQDLLDVRI
jgi:arabinose-5-phosphate isomerase